MAKLTKEEQAQHDQANLAIGMIGGLAMQMMELAKSVDLNTVRESLKTNPGPQFYIESILSTITYVERMRAIHKMYGHERYPEAAAANPSPTSPVN